MSISTNHTLIKKVNHVYAECVCDDGEIRTFMFHIPSNGQCEIETSMQWTNNPSATISFDFDHIIITSDEQTLITEEDLMTILGGENETTTK